jgi:hypothetical protein
LQPAVEDRGDAPKKAFAAGRRRQAHFAWVRAAAARLFTPAAALG